MFINKNYFLIWSGKFVSMIGDRFYTLVLALWVLKESNSPLLMGVMLFASTLPAFLMGIFTGAYVDRSNQKHIMIVTDLLRGLIILCVTYLEMTNMLSIQILIFCSILISVLNAFFEPSIKSIIPLVVRQEELAKANGLEQLINGISSVMAPVFGALAIGTIGFAGGFLMNGLSFVISAVFECFIEFESPKHATGTLESYWDNVKGGITYVSKKRILKSVLIIVAVVHFAVGSFSLIMPFLAESISDRILNLGLLQGALGLGLILGATILNVGKRKKQSLSMLIVYTGILGLTYGVIGTLMVLDISQMLPYLIVVLIMGSVISNTAAFWQLAIQLDTPEQIRGRVFGIVSIISNISFPISFMLVGVMVEKVGFQFYLMNISIVMIFLSVLWRNHFRFNRQYQTESVTTCDKSVY